MRQVGIATFAALRGVSRGLVAAECRTAGCNNLSSDCSNLSSTCAEIHEPYRALSIAMDTTCRRFGGSGAWAPPNTPEPAARRTAPQTTGPQASAALPMSLRQFATQQQTPGKRESLRNRRQSGAAASSLRPIQPGVVHIMGSNNNTILTLTDLDGNTKAWSSAGTMGFKNARKSTPYAAEAAAEKLGADALRLGFDKVSLRIKGLGQGKQAAVKTLASTGVIVTNIQECTPMPHNGCRPPKKRRV